MDLSDSRRPRLSLQVPGGGLEPIQVSAEIFFQELPSLEVRFLKKFLDHDLEQAMALGDFEECRVGAFQAVLEKHAASLAAATLVRNEELANRVAVATCQQLLGSLDDDEAAVKEYRCKVSSANRLEEKRKLAYTSSRYRRGVERCQEKMQNQFRIAHGSFSDFAAHYHAVKTHAKEAVVAVDVKIWTLMVLDLTKWPQDEQDIDDSLEKCSDVLHGDPHAALVILYPVAYSGVTSETTVKRSRLIEDRSEPS